jgi:PAS domain S-box-containing protein
MKTVRARWQQIKLSPRLPLGVACAVGATLILASSQSPLAVVTTCFLIGLGGWLPAHTLQVGNRELEVRLADRTHDLSLALTQIQVSMGRTQSVLDAIGAILHSITDGVIVFDRDGIAIIANPAACQLLDSSAAEIIGTRVETLLQPAAATIERDLVVRLLHDKRQHSGIPLKWRTNQVLSVSLGPVRLNPDNKVIGTVAVFRDFTREAGLNHLKSAFVSMVSHELRTPLVAALSRSEMLLLDFDDPLTDKQREAVQQIAANGQWLLRLVNELLDHAQIEAGQMLSLHPTSFSPVQLLAETQAVMVEIARAKNLAFTTEIAGALPTSLIGDPQRLLQILINLAGNAIKFTVQGTVRVEIGRPDVQHWLLQVSDTGLGIPLEDQPHVFEPFRRGGAHAGAGLGLAIVKHLVGLMDGEIRLSSQVDQGSTFTVILPLVEAAAPPLEPN